MDQISAPPSEPVSVVIPTYNRVELLGRAIDSVLSQTYRNFELLVIDDGSDDGTDELIASYGDKVRDLQQGNLGVAAARNSGIMAARHGLIAFLDSDDLWVPEKLAIQVRAMQENPECLVSHTDEIWYRRGQLLPQKKRHAREGGDIFARCLELCAVGMSTAMVRRRLFTEVGMFDEQLPCCEDYDFWLRVSAGCTFLLVSQPLTIKNGGRADQLSQIHRVGMDRYRIAALRKLIDSAGLGKGRRSLATRELVRRCGIYGNGCLKHGRDDEGRQYLELAEKYG